MRVEKPTVFNYRDYEDAIAENKRLTDKVANLEIMYRIAAEKMRSGWRGILLGGRVMDREVAIEILKREKRELSQFVDMIEAYDLAIEVLKQTEIVRCKDCKWNDRPECPWEWDNEPDDYCSYGERKE